MRELYKLVQVQCTLRLPNWSPRSNPVCQRSLWLVEIYALCHGIVRCFGLTHTQKLWRGRQSNRHWVPIESEHEFHVAANSSCGRTRQFRWFLFRCALSTFEERDLWAEEAQPSPAQPQPQSQLQPQRQPQRQTAVFIRHFHPTVLYTER